MRLMVHYVKNIDEKWHVQAHCSIQFHHCKKIHKVFFGKKLPKGEIDSLLQSEFHFF